VEEKAWTPLKLVAWTVQYFQEHGVEEPRLDAELLLADVLGVERIMLYAGFERVLTDDQLAKFRACVRARAAGRPAKYISGRTEFYSIPLRVDDRVLIPRPETEILVERALQLLAERPRDEFPLVVEIGTGSGAVVIALAKTFPDANYVATDVSPEALGLARENAEANSVAPRIEFLSGDLFDPLATMALEGRVDLIVSNPPYVAEAQWSSLAREIRMFEPKHALVAGAHGTEILARLIDGAPPFLRSGAALLTEMDPSQKDAVSSCAARRCEYAPPCFHRDFAGLWRVAEFARL